MFRHSGTVKLLLSIYHRSPWSPRPCLMSSLLCLSPTPISMPSYHSPVAVPRRTQSEGERFVRIQNQRHQGRTDSLIPHPYAPPLPISMMMKMTRMERKGHSRRTLARMMRMSLLLTSLLMSALTDNIQQLIWNKMGIS